MPAGQVIRELTFGDAEAVLERAQRLLNAGDISEVMKTFASDVVVRFADFPETHDSCARYQATSSPVTGTLNGMMDKMDGQWRAAGSNS
jgi:hypothetical protein